MKTPYEKIMQRIASGEVIIIDSGLSTELEKRGAKMQDTQWSGSVSIESFDLLVDTHRAYIDAGAQVITVNSYASSRLVLGGTKSEKNFEEINRKNIEAALLAREKSGVKELLVAGSISHQASWQRDGTRVMQQIETRIPGDKLHSAFNEIIGFHEAGGVDFLLLEMMNIPYRMTSLFDRVSLSQLPVWCGFSAKQKTKTSPITTFHDEQISFEEIVKLSLEQIVVSLPMYNIRSSGSVITISKLSEQLLSSVTVREYAPLAKLVMIESLALLDHKKSYNP